MPRDAKPSPCDITKPPPADPGLTACLDKWKDEWDKTARYAVYANPPFILNEPKVTIARWHTYTNAKALVKLWEERFMAKNPRAGFGSMGFGIQLEMPQHHSEASASAHIGDLVLVRVTKGTPNPMVTRQFWAVKHVEAVRDGRVLYWRDNAGKHSVVPPRAILVPAAQLDMRLAERLLTEHTGERTMYEGEYSSLDHLLHVLRPALLRGEPTVATDAEIDTLLERYSDHRVF